MSECVSSFREFWIFEIPSLARPKLIPKMSKQYLKLFTLQNICMPPMEQVSVWEFPVTFDMQKYSFIKCKRSKQTTAPAQSCPTPSRDSWAPWPTTPPTSPSPKPQAFATQPGKGHKTRCVIFQSTYSAVSTHRECSPSCSHSSTLHFQLPLTIHTS